MTTPKFNTKSPTIKRILREASELSTSPSPDLHASPLETNLFEWHFTLRGPPSSAFASGIYHGRIILPPTYPLRPPSFRFLTPSGRFETNREICLSISGHHEETWQPAWGIRTALTALRAFMETDAKGQLGGLDTSAKERERVAGQSVAWRCGTCGQSNAEILKASAEAAKERDVVEEVEIPRELMLATKEDMDKKKQGAVQVEDENDEAELAEGFVQTVPIVKEEYPAARPAQSVSLPTGVRQRTEVPQQNGTSQTSTQTRRQPQVSHDGVPIWIDRAIAGLVICIVFMILKIGLGY